MNVRDPFNLHRSPAFNILRATAKHTATNVSQKVIEAGTQALETGKQAVEDMSSFSIPKNVPSFSDPQRQMEDRVWGASGITARSTAHGGGVMSGVQNFFGKEASDLPLYKDKPYSYASSRRRQPAWKRKRTLGVFGGILVLLYLLGFFGSNAEANKKAKDGWSWLQRPEKSTSKVDWFDRRERVKEVFTLSWDAYDRYAWGMSMSPYAVLDMPSLKILSIHLLFAKCLRSVKQVTMNSTLYRNMESK